MKGNSWLSLIFKWSGLCLLLVLGTAPAVYADSPTLLSFTSGGHVLGFGEDGFYLSNGRYLFQTTFVGARVVAPQSDSPATAASQTNAAPALSQVSYRNLWPGISLAYDQGDGLVRSSYTVAAGADPTAIRLQYNVPASLNRDGSLSLAFETGSLTESAPVAWQEIGGQRVPVEIAFQLKNTTRAGSEVGFSLGRYDRQYPLLIDPTLTWNTFLGGTGTDDGRAIALDGSGNVYVAGFSGVTWGSPVRPHAGGNDAFVARLDAASGALIWNTFLGGTGNDQGWGIAVDGSGNLYVAGTSQATWGSPVRPYSVGNDAFAARLDAASGALIWHTFLGGTVSDEGRAIAVDGGGNVYVAGLSGNSWGTPVRAYGGGIFDAFAARLDAASGTLAWNTFLGGTGNDQGNGITVDGSGSVYVAGFSSATWGTPVRAYSGGNDAIAARLDATSGVLTWNTFLGGASGDVGNGITVDSSGNLYVIGYSTATWGSPVRAYTSSFDAFAARLDAASGALTWHTFLGGGGVDFGQAIAVDGGGNVYVAGRSSASWGSPVRLFGGVQDAFAARLDAASGTLAWNTFLGGTGLDLGYGITVDGSGSVYVAGLSNATWGSPVRAYSGGDDAFVASVPQPCFNSAASGLWNSGSTWVGGVVPPTTEGACILNGHTVTLDTSPQIQQLLVEAGGTLVLPLGFSLTAENFVSNNGTMEQTRLVNNANVPFLELRNLAGTAVKYRGVNVNTPNNLGAVTTRVRELNPGEFCTTDPLSPAYARRCYEITATNNLAANVRLWSLSTDLNGITVANLMVYRYTGAGVWTALTSNRTTGTADAGIYSFAEGDTPGFSDFLLGDQNFTPTAVTLQNFSINSQGVNTAVLLLLLVMGGVTAVLLRRKRS